MHAICPMVKAELHGPTLCNAELEHKDCICKLEGEIKFI